MHGGSRLLMVAGALTAMLGIVFADGDAGKPKSSGKGELPAFTAEREAAALKFVEQHHAELGQVLARLKSTNEKEYQQAIRELFRTTENVAASQDAKYTQLMLEAWKTNSRMELLAARLAGIGDVELRGKMESELRGLIEKHVELQHQMMLSRRQAMAAALQVLETNIKRFEDSTPRMVESRFQTLTRVRRSGKKSDTPSSATKP